MNIHLLSVRTGQEVNILRRIRANGDRAWVPRFLEFERDGPEEYCLFPGYVFVWVEDQWRKLRMIRHVFDFVRVAGIPARVPEQVVKDLRAQENDYGFIVTDAKFRIGDRVQIADGSGIGKVIGLETRQRVRVLLNMLGARTELLMLERDLIAA